MMLNNALLVPIHLDAMYLQSDRLVVEEMADFSRLPYVDAQLKREINADNANISESIVSQPFQSQNLHLKKGVHLHWSMPDALTRGIHHGEQTRFPALPNRWLVTRSRESGSKNWVAEETWVVESDYVLPLPEKGDKNYEEYALAERDRSGAISYFYREIAPDSAEPFRYVGRQLPLGDWLNEKPKPPSSSFFPADKPLTALGYGEIAFAAFYPNCHSVFGFYDGGALDKESEYQYEVIGWHSHDSHDPVTRLLLGAAILNYCKSGAPGKDQDVLTKEKLLGCFNLSGRLEKIINGLIGGDSRRVELHEFLAGIQSAKPASITNGFDLFRDTEFLDIGTLEDFDWSFRNKLAGSVPERTLYYSSLTFPVNTKKSASPTPDVEGKVTISIGNTTMEALSAYLAHQLAPEFGIDLQKDEDAKHKDENAKRMERLEDQLESLHLSGKLSNRKLDIGPKFREARHNSGFTPVSSGLRWAVRLQSHPSTSAMPAVTEKNGGDAGELQHANAAHAQAQRRVILPREMTDQLSKLNDLQDQYDTAQRKIGNLRKQLFSDWYKYMMSTYHPADTIRGDDYPDVDEVQFFIEETDIKPLEKTIERATKLKTGLGTKDPEKGAIGKLHHLIYHHNNSLLVHLRPEDPKNFTGLIDPDPKLKFTEDAEADSNGSQAFASCLSFNGNNSFAQVKWEAPLSEAGHGVTLSAWVKCSDGLRSMSVTRTDEIPDEGHSLVIEDQTPEMSGPHTVFAIGELALQLKPLIRGTTPRLAVSCLGVDERIGVISPGRWHHLSVTCENADKPSLVVYIDGRRFPLQFSEEVREKLNKEIRKKLNNFKSLFIGACKKNDTAGFQGKMTQVRVDNRALSPAEVRRDMNGGVRPVYQLYPKAAPRYWQPNEPVILMMGKGIRATERHGQDGRLREDGALECPVIALPLDPLNSLLAEEQRPEKAALDKAIKAFSTRVGTALKSATSEAIAQSEWNGQPWHPIMLEWEVLLQPARGTNDIEGAAFAPDVITANYDLHDNAVNLKVKKDRNQVAAGTVYSNRCYLTPHSGAQLRDRIAEYLKVFLDDLSAKIHEFEEQKKNETLTADSAINSYHEALKKWFEGDADDTLKPVLSKTATFELSRDLLKSLKEWYKKKPTYTGNEKEKFDNLLPRQKADDPAYVVICAGLKLYDANGQPLTFLSQSLGGFNDELLMHKHTMQLPVADPLGFDDYQTFTNTVATLLGDSIHSAPEPTNQFSPIRTGAMSVTRLRLVDTFGQVKDFNEEAILAAGHEIITPQRLTVPDSPHLTWMPPRLVQPARVDFRWLRADESDPDATPICGWVLPNNLQKTLAVYDHRGHALGSILQRGKKVQWDPAPGRNREADEIENLHLAKMVRHILDKKNATGASTGKNFLEDFLTAIENALETIDPESHAQHRSLALLMGRPIAVVRASLDLQLQGTPAVHQGWHAFQQDLRRDHRETDNFTKVQFPVRIGEYQQLNDGVVGYWIEEKVDAKSDDYHYKHDKKIEGQGGTFYAPQTPKSAANRSIDHLDIDIHTADEPVHVLQSIDSPTLLTATLLFDPRGKVHLTSGVLPTKVIDIPAEEYAAALEAIEVTFLTAPMLTAHGTRSVAVPDEPGFAWSWLEHERWLDKKEFFESLNSHTADSYTAVEIDALWVRLCRSGWIEPSERNPDRARIIPMGRRAFEKLQEKDGEFTKDRIELEDRIERLFWSEYSAASIMERDTFLDRLHKLSRVAEKSMCVTVWDLLLTKDVRWLSAIPADPTRARVVPIDERLELTLQLPPDWVAALQAADPPIGEAEPAAMTGKWVERILNTEALELSPVETQARFDAEQEIREGWLVLKNKREET